MTTSKRMNILVLGASGAGKSTLIRSISGAKILTGVGEGTTEKIDVYESETWPFNFIDTKGFEYNYLAQRKTIRQIRKYTKEQMASDGKSDNAGIDAVWYCVEGTSRRTFSHNIELMNKAIKGWRNVPVFAVITKSYSRQDIEENVQAVAQSFAKAKKINLQKIIPVVAKEYTIEEDIKVEPMGIEELCSITLDCLDTAKSINAENRYRMMLEQKRFTANAMVGASAAAAAAIGAVPLSFADAAILVPLETMLTKRILKLYKVRFSGELVSAIVGSAAITNIAKAAITPLKALPIAGQVINGVVAGAIVLALGESVIAAGEALYTGRIDPARIEDVIHYFEEKLQQNPAVGAMVKYLQDNAQDLIGKNSKEIFAELPEDLYNILHKKR